jgi:hypothetical protein
MIRALTILFALALLWAAVVAVLFVGFADLPDPSLTCVPGTLDRLATRLPGQVSTPGDDGYAAATAIWSKPVGRMPRAVVHCQTADDLRSAIRAARDCDLPLSVRGGGHDWAGRALCDGVVIDLSGMKSVTVASDQTGRFREARAPRTFSPRPIRSASSP